MYSVKTVTTIRLTEDQREALDKIAQREDRSRSWVISRAIDEYLERNPDPQK